MVSATQLALNDAAEWLGDFHPLAEQLGSATGLVTLGSVSALLGLGPVHNVATLQSFVRSYHTGILLPFELPAIRSAYGHAERNELRELVALDCQMASEPALQSCFAPSRQVGRVQLQKLRPLQDHRFVKRYLAAVEMDQANGWHMLVYGLTLAVYSLPLRQGLLGYAHQTTRGFLYSAANMLHLSEHDCRGLFDDLTAGLPAVLEPLLAQAPVPAQ